MTTQVLIVGAGPVGLTHALDLGQRGVRSDCATLQPPVRRWRVATPGERRGVLPSTTGPRIAPLEVLDVPDNAVREVYESDLLLVRPDLHVAWRSNTAPTNPNEVAELATGWTPTGSRPGPSGVCGRLE
jgi:hypothetical protein